MEPSVSSVRHTPPVGRNDTDVSVLLFGDLTNVFEENLRQLMHRTENGTLRKFFVQAGLAFREEVARLPAEQQAWLPSFTDLVDLIDRVPGSLGAPALKCGLFCVYQIGRFIESDSFPEAAATFVAGACTGSFAAAAVASSRTMTELIPAGIQAALVAFRTGLHSLKLQREIQLSPSSSDSAESWSFVVNLTEDQAHERVQKFNAEFRRPPSSRPYVSAVSLSSVTISGPPTVLRQLIDTSAIRAHWLPIQSPYHASHLCTPDDVDAITSCPWSDPLTGYIGHIPLLSIASGEVSQQESFSSLLQHAVRESLCQQVRWDKACTGLASALALRKETQSCRIMPIASMAATQLSAALQRETSLTVSVSNEMNTDVKRIDHTNDRGTLYGSKIAIVGYSGRFPEAASNDEFWQLLKDAKDCHRTIPPDRFDWEAHYDPNGKVKNKSRVKFGCFINDPGLFDARFFNLSPREAENTDPAQRLLLMSAYEALEMAGLVPDRTPSTQRDRVGVFMGVTSDDWREVNSGQNIDTYFIPGGNRAFVPGRISYFFRFSGPSISVDTACSSSFAAISTACNYLWRGDCDSAIAGGTNVLTNPDNFVGLDRGHFLSTTGNCNPFDDAANGYCRADAVGAVVLKRMEDAIADNDVILGVIAGASTNHCGQSVSITRPNENDQLYLFQHIIRQTNTPPMDVGYCEMHGTGTQAGDAAEMQSVLSALAPRPGRSLPLYLGAVKANVGHSESASGVTALIKVLLMMKHGEIPPQRVDGTLNRHYPADMNERNVHIAFKSTPWRRQDTRHGRRIAFLNNFSAAGGNTALLLEDAPESKPSQVDGTPDGDPRSFHPIAVSAKTRVALQANIHALAEYLDQNPSLPALSYTTTARRTHYPFRTLLLASDVTTLRTALRSVADKEFKPTPSKKPSVCFVFTGQGSHYSGMGRQLFDQVPSFRRDVISYDRIAQAQGWPSVLYTITDLTPRDVSETRPEVTHVGSTCLQMALSRLWIRWYGEPSAVVGHSLGEYAALFAAGVLSASDTIYLVGSRASLLSKKCAPSTHAMLALRAGTRVVTAGLTGTSCTVACINSPTSTVVSGPKEQITALATSFRVQGVEGVILNIPYAFHSEQVQPILADFEAIAGSIQFNQPRVPYFSPLHSTVINEDGLLDAKYLARATRECVNFQGAIEAASDAKVIDDSTIWLEVGAHPACSGMIKQTLGSHINTACTLRRDVDCWKVSAESLQTLYHAGADIRWNEYHRDFPTSQILLPIPSYKWDLKKYWIDYRNNFCLTKGDDPAALPTDDVGWAQLQAPAPFLSSSVHRIIEEQATVDRSRLVTESNIHDSRLFPILTGHKVNQNMLCPSSLYADMADTIVRHMVKAVGISQDDADLGLDCGSMNIQSPLIAQPGSDCQLLRVAANAIWKDNEVTLAFYSAGANAQKIADHASCTVKLTKNPKWLESWKRNAYLIKSRISSLRSSVDAGVAHKLKRGLVYKLFGSLVEYATPYQGMEQVILDSENLEATAEVRFPVDDGGFGFNPCWIDSLGHIAGFIMNGNDNVHSQEHVFINHGWDAMRWAKPFARDTTYTTYNRMQLTSNMIYVGDTYVFEGDQCVAVFEGVRFQGIKRAILDRILPRAMPDAVRNKAKATSNHTLVAKPAAPPVKRALVPKAPAPQFPQEPQHNKVSQLLKVLSEEIQIEEADLDLDADFADLGIDSLLSLTIVSRLRDELDLDISSADIATHSTIRSFLAFAADEDTSSSQASLPLDPMSGTATIPTPSQSVKDGYSTDASSFAEDDNDPQDDIMDVIRKVISNETGTAIEDISAQISLNDLGVDSLLGLTILGTLSEQLGLDIPSTLFADNETLDDIETALRELNLISAPRDSPSPGRDHSHAESHKNGSALLNPNQALLTPRATSVLLQGSSKSAKKTLFFFPDGAGSATSYTFIPTISRQLVVYGLNCPWLKTPENLRCSLEEYVARFLVEVRQRQPHGPYNLGGASAGGILAYEAAQQLERAGEKVERLILLDTPDPVGLQNPNDRMYDFLDSQGMFGMAVVGKAPKWLRPHFDAFLALLDAYEVQKFKGSRPPQAHIIYAKDGMCKNPEDPRPEIRPDDPREMLWLLNNRTDFSGAGWNQLLGKRNLHINTLENVNHYTILQDGPMIHKLSALIAKAMEV